MFGASFMNFGVAGGEILALGLLAGLILLGVNALTAAGTPAAPSRAAGEPGIPAAEIEQIARYEWSALTLRGERLDVAGEVRWVLSAVLPQAVERSVRLEAAIRPDFAIWLDPRAFRKVLSDIVVQAVAAAPGGKILVTGGDHGGRAQIAVTHDGTASARATAELALRGATEIVAFHGGTLEVDGRAGRGMTTIIRLPAFVAAPVRAQAPAQPQAAPPQVAAPRVDAPMTEALLGSS